ncbi:uncharacterized protein LOC129219656 [Uloborus diversus]|uniref:uncharacterized protein LOC129219656 n=1 Tax=Uloborus diversus TaxID=327109 RepID=UPI00240A8674|nr:uncharacterized protein LOC129219656 [Uloborus diversus]
MDQNATSSFTDNMDIASESAFLGPLVNSTFLPMLLLSLAGQKHTPRTAKTIYREYDYVIVGGGSAGSVLASRLSEIPCVKILLLEAGGPPPLVSEIPAIERLLWHTRIDWDFRTAPQRYTGEALKDRQIVWPSGKTLGGSSVLNAMLTVRGNRQNYDDWAALGATGWSYKDVLPYFIKMEDNRDPEYVANGYHGVGGPQTIHRPRYQPEIKDPIFEASRLMGDKIVDINGRTQIGIYDIQATLRSGQRCSTAKAYLVPAENRTNLDILPNALVRKVIIENRRAIGVRFDFQGDTFEVKAKREVIMSAGTTNSAQLLMLSGIGPRKELERFKIPVIADLPVGKNMQDHCGVPLLFLLSPSIPSALFKVFSPPNILQYITTRTGPLTSASLIPAMSFLNGNHSHTKHSIPDYELYFAELPVEIAETTFGLREEIFEQYYGPYRGRGTYSCISQILHPRSRGTVTLQSTNPSDPPLIDPNYFEDPKDIQDIVEGMKKCMRIGTSGPLQKVGSTPLPNIFPGCEDSATDEDSYYWCMARQFVVTFNHQVGTAKMGDPRDPTTVVDPQLRVKHIKGLRVVDASIMPLVPSGNTNLPTIMVAEKASDIIKSTIKCGEENAHDEWSHEYPSSSPIHSEDLDHDTMDIEAERAFPSPFANATLLPMLLLSLAQQKHSPKTANTIYKDYDYVIVGAGSAGSVLANRLSEISCVNVLLLEAGSAPPLISEIPVISRFLWFTRIDWSYRTTPQRHTGEGMNNREVVWPAGKTLGGSSVLNDVLYVRGNPKDYDEWAAAGAEGWSYDDVFPYFIKLEDNRDPEFVANGYHGVGGPQTAHRPRYQGEIKKPLFQAAKSLGYDVVDSNADYQTGFYDIQGILRSGQRCSTAKAYLVPAENRTNLDILTDAYVRKIIIEKGRAVGVQFDHEGSTYEVKAKREVILSAGATNTPKILMLSGIGPRKELERFKIPIVSDLPVGKNLQDHCGSNENFLLDPSIPEIRYKVLDPLNIQQYLQNRTGPLASVEFIAFLAFLNNHLSKQIKDSPNYQLYILEASTLIALEQFNLRPEVYSAVYAPYEGKPFYACLVSLLKPKSRGTITLRSTDPYDPPVIDPNYLEDPEDIQDLVEGLKTCRRIGTSDAMKKVGSVPFSTSYPGCEEHKGNEDLYYWCQVRKFVLTLTHPVGTAKMGDPHDPTTVVDPLLRVKNVRGLRVIDASVMPTVTSGNTNIPTIMIAEKASDIIKATIKCHGKNPNTDHVDEYDDWPTSHRPTNEVHLVQVPNSFPSKWLLETEPQWGKTNSLTINGNEKLSHGVLPKGKRLSPWRIQLPRVTPWNKELLQNKTLPENASNSSIVSNEELSKGSEPQDDNMDNLLKLCESVLNFIECQQAGKCGNSQEFPLLMFSMFCQN